MENKLIKTFLKKSLGVINDNDEYARCIYGRYGRLKDLIEDLDEKLKVIKP